MDIQDLAIFDYRFHFYRPVFRVYDSIEGICQLIARTAYRMAHNIPLSGFYKKGLYVDDAIVLDPLRLIRSLYVLQEVFGLHEQPGEDLVKAVDATNNWHLGQQVSKIR